MVQLFRVTDTGSTLAHGNGGDFTNQGIINGCYPADSYTFLLNFIVNPGVVASDVRSFHFDGETCGGDGTQQYASVKYYSTDTCTGTEPDTVDLNLSPFSRSLACVSAITQFQSIVLADGLLVSVVGPYIGCRHDAFIWRDSLSAQKIAEGMPGYCLFADSAYPRSPVCQKG